MNNNQNLNFENNNQIGPQNNPQPNLVQNPNVNNQTNSFQNNQVGFQNNPQPNLSQNPNFQNNGLNYEQQPNISSQTNKTKNFKILLLLIIGLIIIILIIFLLKKPKENFQNPSNIQNDYIGADLTYDEFMFTSSSSFFLNNNDSYNLYNEYGQKLTQENFKYASTFINGVAIVENQNNKYGLIKENGQMLIDFNENISYIENFGPFFVVSYINEDFNYYQTVYDSTGKVIIEGEDIHGCKGIYGNHQIALIRNEENYLVYNYKGEPVAAIPKVNTAKDPEIQGKGSYISIYYNNKSYVINANFKLLFVLDDGNYCINNVSQNGNMFLLTLCSDTHKYKLVKNGEIISSFESYESVQFTNNILNSDSNIYNENGQVLEDGLYYDENNYIVKNSKNRTFDLYENGKLKTSLSCENSHDSIAYGGLYRLYDCDKKQGFIFYKIDGTKLNASPFKSATGIDSNNLTIVSDDESNYFLLNTNGEKISSYYDSLKLLESEIIVPAANYLKDDLYLASKDGKQILLNKNGKELVTGDNISVEFKRYALIERDNEYEVFDLVKNKSIITLLEKPKLEKDYFTTTVDSLTKYYAYGSGEIFLEL